MPIHAPKPGNKDWKPAPEGLWRAVCCDVWLETDVETKFGTKDMLHVLFQLEEEAGRVTYEDKDGIMHNSLVTAKARYTLSVNTKSNLRKMVEGWRGKKFASDDEAASFDFEKLVGANAQIQVQHSKPTDDGKVYANVTLVAPPPKGLPELQVEGYVRRQDRDENGDSDSALPF